MIRRRRLRARGVALPAAYVVNLHAEQVPYAMGHEQLGNLQLPKPLRVAPADV